MVLSAFHNGPVIPVVLWTVQQHLCIYADLARCYSSELGHGRNMTRCVYEFVSALIFSMRTTYYKQTHVQIR